MDEELQDFINVHDWIDAGRMLIASDVQRFEADLIHADEDVEKRIKLIGYYFDRYLSDKSVLPTFAKHLPLVH